MCTLQIQKMERTKNSPKASARKRIICFDPSLTAFGYVVMQGNHLIAKGCIKTEPSGKKLRIRKGDDRCRRITEINRALLQIIEEHDVCYIVSEQPHGSQSAVAATALGIVLGIVQTLGDTLNIGVEWYSEGDSKKNALGKQTATKMEMINRMDKLYNVTWFNAQYKNEAVADALAIHYLARNQSNILKMMLL